jgi:hypothetical protein
MKHCNFDETEPFRGDLETYEAGRCGFLARATAAGFEDDINALVTNYALDDESRAHLRLLIDQHGLSGRAFATSVSQLQSTGKIAPGVYHACLALHGRIPEALDRVEIRGLPETKAT